MSTLPATRKRKRAKRACTPCHQRKRKCDGQLPCETCSTYEYDCTYASAGESGARPVPEHGGFDHSNSSSTAWNVVGADKSAVSTPIPAATISNGCADKQLDTSAVMSFPETLGISLGSENPPKRNWYGYKFGTQHEQTIDTLGSLSVLIHEADLTFFSNIFFSILAPIADLVDQKVYSQRCRDHYRTSGGEQTGFCAIAAGVAALGSCLSTSKHPREFELVQYAKGILDDPASMRKITPDHVVAWSLRTFYLRATANPISCWITSCTTMHLVELVGIHEEENIGRIASKADMNALGYDEDRLRMIFWILWAGHSLLSYECDRSPVQYQSVTIREINSENSVVARQFVRMAQIIPTNNSPFSIEPQAQSPRADLTARLKALYKLPTDHPFLVATKADLAFCFYRRIFQLKEGIPHDVVTIITNIGDAAVEAAALLATQDRMLWNTIGSVFQYICVSLSIDTATVSVHIAMAFRALEDIVKAVDTVLTREALSVAQHLLSLNVAKKRKELSRLESISLNHPPSQAQSDIGNDAFVRNGNWELDWGQFLFEPYFSMLGFDTQS